MELGLQLPGERVLRDELAPLGKGRAWPHGAEPRAAAGDRGSLTLHCSLSSSRVTSLTGRGGRARGSRNARTVGSAPESSGAAPGAVFALAWCLPGKWGLPAALCHGESKQREPGGDALSRCCCAVSQC